MYKILFVLFMLAAVTFGQQPDRRKFSFAVDVTPSLTIAAPKPVFNQDWQRFFVPPKDGMTLGGTSHPVSIGVELRVVRILRWKLR